MFSQHLLQSADEDQSHGTINVNFSTTCVRLFRASMPLAPSVFESSSMSVKLKSRRLPAWRCSKASV
ncbi:hypothetical protein OPV22_023204 [Ensete ventricosum]|uniref:Uncharacterized protein n=1 Tax=Ensete ventricosum TaxID=4639 RepID=A0AAV8QSE7_ENSVE|nr:hypothetical protein OPV22_023204 [Ensete ventricosum]